jgi:hypothetical protein
MWSCSARRRRSTRIIHRPAPNGITDSGSRSTRTNARRTLNRSPWTPRTSIDMTRFPGVCPVVDQKNVK